MTRVVATLTNTNPLTAAALAHDALREGAHLVEARLDHLLDGRSAEDARDAVRFLGREIGARAIATLRPLWEGGRFGGPEEDRRELLQLAAESGFHAVDVEAAAEFTVDARRVIVSRHDFDATPDEATLRAWLHDARDRGAWCAKIATTTRRPTDARALVAACEHARRERIPYAIMAVNDPFLRLLAPALGMRLAYGAAPDGDAAAPGQLPVGEVAQAHASLPTPGSRTHAVYLFGDPVAHSLSPRMQNAAFRTLDVDAVYLAARIPPERVGAAVDALRTLDALGANVTVPHKLAVLEHVDEVAASAEAAGAANTLVQHQGRVTAHNTDGVGAVRALEEAGARVEGARVLMLGAGGAARAVAHALDAAGARLEVTNRTPERARELGYPTVAWANAPGRVQDVDVLVNCTTVGMHDADASPLPAASLHGDLTVLDAVYRREGPTRLVRDAEAAGARAAGGERMLLHQGAECFRLWTNLEAPVDVMDRGLRT